MWLSYCYFMAFRCFVPEGHIDSTQRNEETAVSHKFLMKHIAGLVFVAMSAALLFTVTAQAQNTASGGYKIAVVDIQKLLSDSKKREEKYNALQNEVDKMQTDIDVMSKKIEKDKADFEANKDKMTDDERSTKVNDIKNQITTYQAEMQKRQRTIDGKEETVLKEVLADIQAAIAKISEKEGYHLVLNIAGGPRGGVVYHSPTLDITSQVLQTINNG